MLKEGEKIGVGQIPSAAGGISHGIDGTRNIVVPCQVPVMALMQCIVPEQVGAGGHRRGRPFGRPGYGGTIIAGEPNGAFAYIACLSEDVLVRDHSCELEIGDRERARRIVERHERAGNARLKPFAPYNRRCVTINGQPDASHANLASVTGPDMGRPRWNKLEQSCRASCQCPEKVLEIRGGIVDVLVEADTSSVAVAKRRLQGGE